MDEVYVSKGLEVFVPVSGPEDNGLKHGLLEPRTSSSWKSHTIFEDPPEPVLCSRPRVVPLRRRRPTPDRSFVVKLFESKTKPTRNFVWFRVMCVRRVSERQLKVFAKEYK